MEALQTLKKKVIVMLPLLQNIEITLFFREDTKKP